jgi:hypothetical protein
MGVMCDFKCTTNGNARTLTHTLSLYYLSDIVYKITLVYSPFTIVLCMDNTP